MTEIYSSKSNFWEPEIGGETFKDFINFVKENRGIKDEKSINIVKSNAIEILKRCIDPNNKSSAKEEKRTILHVGEVQSGKTLAMCSVIALAYDNDFLISTVLTGTKNLLKAQNQDRIKEVLLSIDPLNEKFVYFSEPDNNDEFLNSEINGLIARNRFRKKNKMIVFTMLKHQNSIKRLSELFAPNNLNVKDFKINSLILDDEADQASPNTQARSNNRSPINKNIIKLRENHSKFCTYIQVTATAQPLFLIAEDDPLSPDFISLSESSPAYIGIKDYFQTQTNRDNYLSEVDPEDIPEPDNNEAYMPEALKDAIKYFIVSVSIAENLKKPLSPPFTLLCHPDWRKEEHERYAAWIRNYISNLKEEIQDDESLEILFEDFERYFINATKNFINKNLSYEDIKDNIGKIIESNPAIRIINDRNPIEGELKEFWRKSNYHIIIGGNCLDRGFTVEGLLVTYLTRTTGKNSDTIQQRARFCGYKQEQHKKLSRLWLDKENIHFFKNYIVFEETIRKTLSKEISEFKPHKKQGFEMPLVKPFQLTRTNVHGELNIGGVKDWFKPQYNQYLDTQAHNSNNQLLFHILENYSHTFTNSENQLWRCFQSNQLSIGFLKGLLNKYITYTLEAAPKNIMLSILETFSDDFKDSDNILTCFMTDTDALVFDNLDDYLNNNKLYKGNEKYIEVNHPLVYKRGFSFPKEEKYNLPTTNLHRGKGIRKGKPSWTADNLVFNNKVTLQISLNKYHINKEEDRNDNHPTHQKIDSLFNYRGPSMSLCMRLPEFSEWRTFSN